MKKKTINAFTLVEMLIVIVIIGILIAALMPRMQSAQGRARDVARKNDLAQIQTAIVTSQQDKGNWPGMASGANGGIKVEIISEQLITAGMSSVPKDPLSSTSFKGLGKNDNEITGGNYGYMVTKRNGTSNGGFVLMAKTEIEGGSNWVVCSGATTTGQGLITSGTDLKEINPCVKLSKGTTCGIATGQQCNYQYDGELRYILVY